jgi:lipopolysaccharide biosynthesis glycosyltransferase
MENGAVSMLINIAFAFDNVRDTKYWQYATTTICQMLSRTSIDNQYNVDVIVPPDFNCDLERVISKINSNKTWKIIYIHPNFNFEKFYNWTTPATFWRLLLPTLLPNVNKIAYFDPDVYFNCDVSEFYNINLDSFHAAGVKDLIWLEWKHQHIYHFHKRLVKNIFGNRELAEWQDYICAGVILMDLNKMREDKIFAKIENLFDKNWKAADQDILNTTCSKKMLPIEYGCFNTKMYKPFADEFNLSPPQLAKKLRNPKIVHCNYPKFWNKKARSYIFWMFMQISITGRQYYKEWNNLYKLLFQ